MLGKNGFTLWRRADLLRSGLLRFAILVCCFDLRPSTELSLWLSMELKSLWFGASRVMCVVMIGSLCYMG